MVTVIDIRKLNSGIKLSLIELINIIDPRRTENFFENMRLQEPAIIPLVLWGLLSTFVCMLLPLFIYDYLLLNIILILLFLFTIWLGNYITDFLLSSGYFTYLGYFISCVYGKVDNVTATKVGFLYFFTGIFFAVCMAYMVIKFSNREIELGESFSFVAYSVIPALLGGIFAASSLTYVLCFLFVAYSVYIFYIAIKVRVGFERAGIVMITTILSSGAITIIAFRLLALLLGVPTWAF